MKLTDVNTYVGRWPFQPLPWCTVSDLLRQMDAAEIATAWVANLHGLFYKDPQEANAELAAACESHRDRLVPVATLNPNYIGWEEDLHRCAGELGFRAVRLFPLYHRYELDRGPGLALLEAAAGLGLPVQIPIRVMDLRQRHWLDVERELRLAEVAAAIRVCPHARFVVLESRGLPPASMLREWRDLRASVFLDLARQPVVYQDQGRALIEGMGANRLLFGSGMLLKPAAPARLRFEHLPVADEDRQQVAWRNAAELLGLGGREHGNPA